MGARVMVGSAPPSRRCRPIKTLQAHHDVAEMNADLRRSEETLMADDVVEWVEVTPPSTVSTEVRATNHPMRWLGSPEARNPIRSVV